MGSTASMRYISVADTAKLIRKALKDQFKADFPHTKFSVRSSSYSGGASINIRWTDGPAETLVAKVAKSFEGADFDGMQDLKTYHTSIITNTDGSSEEVRLGADFVHTSRELSPEVRKLIDDRLDAYRVDPLDGYHRTQEFYQFERTTSFDANGLPTTDDDAVLAAEINQRIEALNEHAEHYGVVTYRVTEATIVAARWSVEGLYKYLDDDMTLNGVSEPARWQIGDYTQTMSARGPITE